MEDLLMGKAVEYSIVAGGFVYLLIFQTKTIVKGMENISTHMQAFGGSLAKVSEALTRLDARVEALERRVEDVAKEVK